MPAASGIQSRDTENLNQPLPGGAGLQGILRFQVADAGPCPDKPCRGLVMLGTRLIHLPLFESPFCHCGVIICPILVLSQGHPGLHGTEVLLGSGLF